MKDWRHCSEQNAYPSCRTGFSIFLPQFEQYIIWVSFAPVVNSLHTVCDFWVHYRYVSVFYKRFGLESGWPGLSPKARWGSMLCVAIQANANRKSSSVRGMLLRLMEEVLIWRNPNGRRNGRKWPAEQVKPAAERGRLLRKLLRAL
jgi:hypothetical protein